MRNKYILNAYSIKLDNFVEHIIIIGLLGTILLPSIKIGIGINLITVSSLLLIILFPFLITKKLIFINRFVITYSLILLVVFYSIAHSYLALDVPITYRDYMEFFRYVQILPYFIIASSIDYNSFSKKLEVYFSFSILFIIIISFLEIFNPGNLAYNIGLIYSSPIHTEHMISHSHRIIITGTNPNNGALIIVFFLMFTISRYLNNKTLFDLVNIFLLIGILLMTQSRTVLVGFISSIFLILLFLSSLNIFQKIFMLLIGLFIFIGIIFLLDLQYIIIGFETLFDGTNNSLTVRLESLTKGYDRFLSSPIFGWGPAKNIHSTIIDSEYIMIMQRYGLLGMLVFSIFLLSIISFSIKLINNYKSYTIYPLITFSFMIVGLFVMITNNFLSGYQTNSMIVLLVILNISFFNYIKQTRSINK